MDFEDLLFSTEEVTWKNSRPVWTLCSISNAFGVSELSSLFQGVNYLVENKLLEWTAQSVAEFLYKEEGLNKTAIGDFLGER